MQRFKSDFTGFTFNNLHSADMGLARVSGGDRYDYSILPSQEVKTIAVPGRDGEFFIEANYQPRNITIQFAYDHLTESEFVALHTWFGDRKERELWFDEAPYKVYSAKVTGEPNLTFIPFDDPKTKERIYKGEGQVQFIAYFPFAKSRFKVLSSEHEGTQWAESSGILNEATMANYNKINNGVAALYNPGDIATPLSIAFTVQDNTGYQAINKTLNGAITERIIIDMSLLTVGRNYTINSFTELIERAGLAYNHAIAAGTFLKVVPNKRAKNGHIDSQTVSFDPLPGNKIIVESSNLKYDYLYF